MVRCTVCKRRGEGWTIYHKGKTASYCLSHLPSFRLKCPFCGVVLVASKPERQRHILIPLDKGRASIMCPKVVLEQGKHVSYRLKDVWGRRVKPIRD